MANHAEEPTPRFVPVSEKMRERIRHARLGAAWSRGDLLLLLSITLLAALLRFWQIEIWSVSAAEAATWHAATAAVSSGSSIVELLLRVLFEQGLLPAHGEGWLRLPFLFAGTLAVPVLALAGEALVGRRAALLAALLLALSPWHVEICQTATGHGAALTLALLGLGSAYVGSRTGSTASWLLAGGALLAAGLCHAFGWLALPIVIVGWQLRQWPEAERGDRRRLVFLATLLFAGILAVVLLLRGPDASGEPAAIVGALWGWLTAAGLPVVALALLLPLLAVPRTRRRLVVVAALVPLGVLVMLGLFAIRSDRDQALLVLPPLLLLAATAALRCFDRVRVALGGGRRLAVLLPAGMAVVAVALDLAVGTFLYATQRRGSRPDWRRARDQIVRTAERSSLLVVAAAGRDSLLYYLRPNHWRGSVVDPHPGIAVDRLDLQVVDLVTPVAHAVARSADLFLVLLEDELAVVGRDAAARSAMAAFELREVLPCAGTQRDETIYVYRWRGER